MKASRRIRLWCLGLLLGVLSPEAVSATGAPHLLPSNEHAACFTARSSVGSGKYRAASLYRPGDIVAGRDANAYRALRGTVGHDPTQDNGRNWRLYSVTARLTLTVPTRFADIAAAWRFVQSASISQDGSVTIKVADGTYRTSTPLLLNHPDGARIRLVGNASTPRRCKLLWPAGQDGIVVSGNHTLGMVQGFTLVGQANRRVPPYSEVGEALAAYDGATIHAQNVACSQWWHGFHASDSSNMTCTDCSTASIGDAGFFCYNGGTMICTRCVGASGNGGYPLGFGFLAELASSLFLTDCTAKGGNTAAGIGGFTNSSLEIRACTSQGNHQGLWLDGGSVAEIIKLICSSNTLNNISNSPNGGAHGLLLQGGSKIKSGSSGITATHNGGRGLWVRDNSIFMAQQGIFSHNYSGLFVENNSSIDATNLTVQSNAYEGVLAVNNSFINLGTNSVVGENGGVGFGYAVNFAPIAGEWGNNHCYIQTTAHVNPARPLLTGNNPYLGSPPARVLGTGAGKDAHSSGSGRDTGGQISVITGTQPAPNMPVVTVTFARPYSSPPVVMLCAADENSAAAVGQIYVRSTPTGFTIHATATALAAGKTYTWNYSVPGN